MPSDEYELTESQINNLLDALQKRKHSREVTMVRGRVTAITGNVCSATIADGEVVVPMRMADGLGLVAGDEVYIFGTGPDKVVGFKLQP
jgi:hypothetical protein